MVSGRLREHDREKIANELVEWAKLPDSLNLNKFCCTREPPIAPSKITHWAKEDEFFRQAYEIAKSYLGARREEMLSSQQLHVKAYDLNATVYDQFLKDEKRIQAEYEANLISSKTTYNPQDLEKVEGMLNVLREIQDMQSALRTAERSNNKE